MDGKKSGVSCLPRTQSLGGESAATAGQMDRWNRLPGWGRPRAGPADGVLRCGGGAGGLQAPDLLCPQSRPAVHQTLSVKDVFHPSERGRRQTLHEAWLPPSGREAGVILRLVGKCTLKRMTESSPKDGACPTITLERESPRGLSLHPNPWPELAAPGHLRTGVRPAHVNAQRAGLGLPGQLEYPQGF